MNLSIESLWRYPVKSLAGEQLTAADLTVDGIVGDRVVHVRGPGGAHPRSNRFPSLTTWFLTAP